MAIDWPKFLGKVVVASGAHPTQGEYKIVTKLSGLPGQNQNLFGSQHLVPIDRDPHYIYHTVTTPPPASPSYLSEDQITDIRELTRDELFEVQHYLNTINGLKAVKTPTGLCMCPILQLMRKGCTCKGK